MTRGHEEGQHLFEERLVNQAQAGGGRRANAEIEVAGRKALVIPADIQDVSQIRKVVDTVHTTFGRINILINNAAWTATVEALEATEEEWDRTLDTSLKAVFLPARRRPKL